MKKRFLATLLSAVMVITLFPISAHASYPNDAASVYDYFTNHMYGTGTLFLDTEHQTVKLMSDFSAMGMTMELTDTVTLDLNGHNLSISYQINVQKGTLILTDSFSSGKVICNNGNAFNVNGGTLDMQAGTIIAGSTNSVLKKGEAAVTVISGGDCVGAFIMNGGTIYDPGTETLTEFYYAVNVDAGTFTMNAGTIIGGSLHNATVKINDTGTFVMNGGSISNMYEEYGYQALYVGLGGTATMNNGSISANAGYPNGTLGPVTIEGGNFIMNGGEINKNGKGICAIGCSGTATVSGGTIYRHINGTGISLGGQLEGCGGDLDEYETILTLTGVAGKTALISGIIKRKTEAQIIISANTKVMYNGGIATSLPWEDYPNTVIVTTNNPAVTITTDSFLPDGVVGTTYSAQLAATPPVALPETSWQLSDGILPPGINLDISTGKLSGTPTTAGEWKFYASVLLQGNYPELLAAKMFIIDIADSYSISGSPTDLDFAADEGYTPSPAAQSVTITNMGSGSIHLNAPALTTGINFTIITPAGFTDAFESNTTKSFSVQPVEGLAPGTYTDTVTVTGSNNTSTTVNVSFTVKEVLVAPFITSDPVNARVAVGSTATFEVAATGKPAPAYQWQVSANRAGWADVSDGTGADTASYITPATTLGMDGWQYRCVVTNSEGTATSEPATLNVSTPVSGVTVTPETARIAVTKTVQLTANISPDDATTKTITWSSSDESVATVSLTGLVTAVKAGVATITATTDDGSFTDTCVVTVYTPVSGVTVTPETARIAVTKTVQLTANISPDDATTKTITWSSSDESVATVSSTGLITAVKAGMATITATTKDEGFGEFADTCEVTVYIPVSGVTVTPATARIAVSKTVQLAENVLPADAATKTVQWSSSDDSIATVSSTGLVTAVDAGIATITVTTNDGGFTDDCEVTVYTPSIAITQNGNELNDTLRLRLPWYKAFKNVSFNLGCMTNTEDYARIEWSSDNEKVIVDQNGKVTNSKTGNRSANITVNMFDDDGNVIATDTVNLFIYKYENSIFGLLISLVKTVLLNRFVSLF